MNFYKTFIEPAVSIFLPALCIQCSSSLPSGRKIICKKCYNELQPLHPDTFNKIKKTFRAEHIDKIYILFQFSQLFQELIHLLKYQRHLTIAKYFAESLAGALSEIHYDCITAVPLNPVRCRERGFNQSALIASKCAEIMQVDFEENMLVRNKNTQSQTKLTRKQRIENIRDAFSINGSAENLKILIIDDVITTGSTLNECAGVLKKCGADIVDAAAAATPVDSLELQLEDEAEKLEIL